MQQSRDRLRPRLFCFFNKVRINCAQDIEFFWNYGII